MLILPRYVLRNHLGPFIFGTAVVMFLFFFQFLLNALDKLLGKGLSTEVILQFIWLNLAWMVVLAVPMGVLFSTLMAFGTMSANHETTIMKASGIGLWRIMIPVMFFGFIISLTMFWFNDAVLPDANHLNQVMMSDIIRKKPSFNIEQGQFSTQLEGYTILSRYVDSSNGLLRGLTIYDRTTPGRTNVVSADSGTITFSPDYSQMTLMLLHGEIHQLSSSTPGDYKKIFFTAQRILIPASGYNFERTGEGMVSRSDREMRIRDMRVIVNDAKERRAKALTLSDSLCNAFINSLLYAPGINKNNTISENSPEYMQADKKQQDRYKNRKVSIAKQAVEFFGKGKRNSTSIATTPPPMPTSDQVIIVRNQIESFVYEEQSADEQARKYEVEIYKKYSIPFACFIFVLVGCPLGIATRGGNFGVSALMSLGFYIIYWACLISGEKLADRRLASPALMMWMGNIIIGILGLILMYRFNFETYQIGFLTRFVRLLRSPFQKPQNN